MRTTVMSVFKYPEVPKFEINSGVINPIEIIIPRRKTRGEKEQVHRAIKPVIQKIIKPLKTALDFKVKIASANITVSST